MTEIYIAFVDTPGIFASIIRRVIKQKYIHVAIGLDENLDEAYSIGRRHPSIPLIAGFSLLPPDQRCGLQDLLPRSADRSFS